MKIQEINLECEMTVLIDHKSRTPCLNCGKDIFLGNTKTKKIIQIELVGLAKWDLHCCVVKQ